MTFAKNITLALTIAIQSHCNVDAVKALEILKGAKKTSLSLGLTLAETLQYLGVVAA